MAKLTPDQEYHQSLAKYQEVIAESGLVRSKANNVGRTFVGHDTNISVKSEYTRSDYDYFRTGSTIPERYEEVLPLCLKSYEKVGIIKNVIDLMSDFGSKGIRLQHPNKTVERFYKKWFKKVQGIDRSERFLNNLYKSGSVLIYAFYGKITLQQSKKMQRIMGEINDGLTLPENTVEKRTIPLQYSFLNPLSVEVIGDEISTIVGKPIFALKLSTKFRSQFSQFNRLQEKEQNQNILENMPQSWITALKNNQSVIQLDQTKISAFYYKKDDWQLWPKPMIYSILDDLIMLDRTKLADISALDGAISNIRLWTLGKLDGPVNSVLPTAAMISKLKNILANNLGGGTLDLVWGPELSFKETNTSVHQFLGADKYKPILDAIYDGLGIPPTLRSGGPTGNNSNNFVSLNTLLERLEYGRKQLISFWMGEIEKVQKAMGFSKPATIVFDRNIMSDAAAERALLIDLADRNIISDETVREQFNFDDDIEMSRIKSENKKRGTRLPTKTSPYHNPQIEEDLKKILLTGGVVTPSELGIELEPRKSGEIPLIKQQEKLKQASKPVLPGGRPKNVTEKKKRKPKSDTKPKNAKAFMDIWLWSHAAQEYIGEISTKAVLGINNKTDVRSLSKTQAEELEQLKFNTLLGMEPLSELNEQNVYNSMQTNNLDIVAKTLYDNLTVSFITNTLREPNQREKRSIQLSVYSIIKDSSDGND